MAAPVILNIPEAKRKTWAQFSKALVEQAVKQDTDKMRASFALLVKHCADDAGVEVLRRLCDGTPADVATTILAYLPEGARKPIAKRLKENREERETVLQFIGTEQAALREAIRETLRENPDKYPELRKVAS
jgi:hypothetical protein